MLYSTLTIKDKDYNLRLNAKSCVDLERKLGTNPVNVLVGIDENKMPSIDTLITILHYSLQAYNHGISVDDTYAIYDDMVDEGKGFADLLKAIVEVFKVSGLIPNDEKETNEKN